MLKHKFYILATLFVGLAFGACNEIDEADRFEEVPLPTMERTVLFEEFTGQNCINCPSGHEVAKQLQDRYPGKVIVVSIHAGAFATRNFKSDAGDAYWKHFYSDGDVQGYPAAMVNRDSEVSTNFQTEWSQKTEAASKKPSLCSLDIQVDYDGQGSIKVLSTLKNTTVFANQQLKLLYLLTESKIKKYQLSTTGTIEEYEHNHVLRGVIGDKNEQPNYWGDELTLPDGVEISPESEIEHRSVDYKLDKEWVPENMHVVGVLYDADTYEVLQAAEVAVVSGN